MSFSFLFDCPTKKKSFLKRVRKSKKTNPQKKTVVADLFYGASIISFTAGSIIKGVLDIYGTTNSNIKFYWILGIMLLIVASIYGLINHLKSKK